jgi:hypothetical protein
MGIDLDVVLGTKTASKATGLDLDDFMAAVDMRNNNIKERSTQVQEVFAKQAEDAAKILAAQQQQGEASMVVAAAKEYEALETQNKVQKQATTMGVNPGVASEVLDAVSEEWKAAKLASIQAQQKLAKDLNVNFFDAPVDYIVAQVGLEKTVMTAEAAAKRSQVATQSFADIQSMTQHLPGQMAALSTVRTQATIDATLKGAQAAIDEKLADQRIKNAGIDISRIQTLETLDTHQLNNLATGMSMQNQAEGMKMDKQRFAMSQAQFAQSQQEFEWRKKEQLERIQQKDAAKQELEDVANVVRLGAASFGFENVKAFPASKIISMLNSKQADIHDFYVAGMNSQVSGRPILSDNVGKTASMLVQHNAPGLPVQKVVTQFLKDTYNEAGNPESGRTAGYDHTKPDQVTKAATNMILGKAKIYGDNIKDGDATNIYSPPPLDSVLTVPGVKNSEWYKKVMDVQVQAGGLKEFKPEQLVSLTAEAVKSGKLKFNEASSGLQAAFVAATALNNATRNYRGMGLPEQDGYRTKLPDSLGIGRKYDLIQAQDINRALSIKLRDYDPNKQLLPRYLVQ